MWDLIRSGSIAIFAVDDERLSECRAFITRLGGQPDTARVFSTIGALRKGMKKGFDVIVKADDGALFCEEGYPVFDLARQLELPFATVFDVSIIEPDAARIEALLGGDPEVWDPLLDQLMHGHLGKSAPRSFMGIATEVCADVDVWTTALMRAIDSGRITSELAMDFAGRTKRRFFEWFASALAESGSSPDAYDARLTQLERTPSDDVAHRCRELRDEVAKRGPDYDEIHARACLIYTARLLEEGAWDEADHAASEAIEVCRRRGDRNWELVARRLQAGAWFGRLEIARAFEQLDEVLGSDRRKSRAPSAEEDLLAKIFGETAAPGPVLHAKRFFVGLAPLEEAKRDVAFQIQCIRGYDDEAWRGALAKLAKHAKGRHASIIRARLRG